VTRHWIIVIIIACVLVSGCTEYILSQGSLSVQSDPSGAGIYLDGEFKGTTPAVIHAIPAGTRQIELRHEKYPLWDTNVSIIAAQTINITADLSDNLVPFVSVDCITGQNASAQPGGTRCLYRQGETIKIFGTAVRPHPKADPYVTFVLNRGDEISGFSPLRYDTRINNDTTFTFAIANTTLPGGIYTVTATIPAGASASVNITVESPSDTNIRILRQIVEEYHATHTYTLPDFYVCADMAQDVWNMVETRGMQAKIAAGNIEQPDANVKDYNHAWVLAQYAPGDWIAMETTGGYLVPNNPGYYRGIFFASPKDFKTYLDLMQDYNSEVGRITTIADQYNAKVTEYNTALSTYNTLVNTYNNDYANRALSSAAYQQSLALKSELDAERLAVTRLRGELDQLGISLAAEREVFAGIKSRMDELVEKGKNL
jgi:hypothetical protein